MENAELDRAINRALDRYTIEGGHIDPLRIAINLAPEFGLSEREVCDRVVELVRERGGSALA